MSMNRTLHWAPKSINMICIGLFGALGVHAVGLMRIHPDHKASTYLWLAGNEGMEKKMESLETMGSL